MFDRSGGAGGCGSRTAAAPAGGGRAGRSLREARACRVGEIRRAELRIEALVLRDAAEWAIEHGVDESDPFAAGPAGGAGRFVGSDGTPWIDEHVGKEYGALRATSTFEATDLIIDALDLRHRLPRLWQAVHQLRVRVRYARKISKACRDLSRDAAAVVDAELARKAAWGLPWARLEKILAAAIINADPALHEARLAAARFDRRVWLSASEDGLRTMVIRADEGDQVLLYATIERIAEILLLEGDTDPVAQRRSKAAGWLARPEDLTVLLYKHAGGPAPADPAGDLFRSDAGLTKADPSDADPTSTSGSDSSEADGDEPEIDTRPATTTTTTLARWRSRRRASPTTTGTGPSRRSILAPPTRCRSPGPAGTAPSAYPAPNPARRPGAMSRPTNPTAHRLPPTPRRWARRVPGWAVTCPGWWTTSPGRA